MSILNQKTVNSKISISGIGLHSGKNVNLNILPANPNEGINFKRVDIVNDEKIVSPLYNNVGDTNLCTTITNHAGVKVSTIEHLMAALYILGIDNVLIELDSHEVPILDGSSKDWISIIKKAGIKNSNSPIKVIKINKTVEIKNKDKFIRADVSNINLDIDFEIKYPNTMIGTQKNKISVYNDNLEDIYNSRTFCKYEDIDNLKRLGLAKGGSLDNALVVDKFKLLNKEGLRNNKEFVNHKILDCIGDIYLSGYKIVGSITCSQGGHSLTHQLLVKLFSDKKNYSVFELKGKNLPHSLIEKYQLKSIA